jgi:hypothetical protein
LNESRNNWFLLTGMFIGLGIGLLISLLLNPVSYTNVAPRSMDEDGRNGYRLMVALAYQANGDLGRAQARLKLLADENPAYTLGAQAQRTLAETGNTETARALAQLAADHNKPLPRPALVSTPTPTLTATLPPEEQQQLLEETADPEVTPTPLVTFTPRAALRTVPTLGAPFDLRQRQIVCDPGLPEGLLQVEVVDGQSEPVAGVRAQITWSGGEDQFFTGLYPRISPGYADFQMMPEIVYSLRVGEAGETVTGLYASPCQDGEGNPYWGGWLLRFGQQ